MSKRMLVLCPYPHGVAAGQRLKFEQYYDDWRAAGWKVDVAPFMDMALWRVLYERGHFAAKLAGVTKGYVRRLRDLFRLRALRSRLLSHVRDSARHQPCRASDAGACPEARLRRRRQCHGPCRPLRPRPSQSPAALPSRFRKIQLPGARGRSCRDQLPSAQRALQQRSTAARACTYISSSVDADRFQPANRHSNDGLVTIGWTGTFSSRQYLDLLRGVLQKLAQQRRFRLRVIGNFDYQLPGVDLEVVRWTAEREIEDLQAIDIGLYPLPADEWVSGKSGLKAIQYMAMGLPCVATDCRHDAAHHPRRREWAAGQERRRMAQRAHPFARRSGAAPPAG